MTRFVTDKVFELRNIHKGESCYIIGDGVSLKWFDLHSLPKKKIFALNWAVFHNDLKRIGFEYAINTGPYQFVPFIEHFDFIREDLKQGIICKHYRKTMKENPGSKFFLNLSNYPFVFGKDIYFLFKNLDAFDFAFSKDCQSVGEKMYDGSLKCALALAIFMGFSEVLLLGCDYTHEKSRMRHWYEKGEGTFIKHPGYQKSYFDLACNYTNIVTVTSNGKGSFLPSMTYSELTGLPLCKYRENHLLADKASLKALSSWHNYLI